eukprot:m.94479 g.94479  ORF g.94479 m.94479 type:complete len:151 (+) comp12253_c0_seq1:3399-3851(+)
MLSPVLAVAATLVLASLHLVGRILGLPDAPDNLDSGNAAVPDSSDSHREKSTVEHRLPILCIVALEAVHTLYVVVLLSVTGLGSGGWSVAGLNWILLFSACWVSAADVPSIWHVFGITQTHARIQKSDCSRSEHADQPQSTPLTEKLLPT